MIYSETVGMGDSGDPQEELQEVIETMNSSKARRLDRILTKPIKQTERLALDMLFYILVFLFYTYLS